MTTSPLQFLHGVSLFIALTVFTPFALASPPLAGSFSGTLPCASCPGIETRLHLTADGIYILQEQYIDRQTRSIDTMGRWLLSSDNEVLALYGSKDSTLFFSVGRNSETLEKRDTQRQRINSALNYRLQRQDTKPLKSVLHLQLDGQLSVSQTDLPTSFTECVTGKTFAIAETGAYNTLLNAYLNTQQKRETETPSLPLVASIRGRLEADSMLVIEQFEGFHTTANCSAILRNQPLIGSLWRPITTPPSESPSSDTTTPYLTFEASGHLHGSTGCAQLTAQYTLNQNTLSVTDISILSTTCLSTVEAQKSMLEKLDTVHTWRITGTFLDLYNAGGEHIGEFKAARQ